QMRVQWVDGYGSPVVGSNPSSAVSTTVDSGPCPRLSMLADPMQASPLPAAGAAGLVIQTRRFAVMTQPAVTWTTAPQPWAEGKAAERVWLRDVENSAVQAVEGEHYHTAGWRFVEVAA